MVMRERVAQLAGELERLKLSNIAKLCSDRWIANDMSMVLAAWMMDTKTLDKAKLIVCYGHFKSHMALYTEIMRVMGSFVLPGLADYIDLYIEFYKTGIKDRKIE